MYVPGLLQQYTSYLQTFQTYSEVEVIPQNQKQDEVFLMSRLYRGKAIITNLDNASDRDVQTMAQTQQD
jgi:hypothetical protein